MAPLAASSPSHSLGECFELAPCQRRPWLDDPCTAFVRGCPMSTLVGRRVLLRPLSPADFPAWQEVRRRNNGWLTPWEPARTPGMPDVVESREAFAMRCSARERERQLGTAFGFGMFVAGRF